VIKRMTTILLVLGAALVFVWFCLANSSHARVSFFVGQADVAVFLVILISFLMGFATCSGIAAIRRLTRGKKRARRSVSQIVGEI
jgi:uncharacterized integral membrane protein